MAYTFIARMKIHPDKETDFIAAAHRMEDAVKQNEPGALIYKFFRLEEDYHYAVIESFVDEAADQAHQQYDHFKEIAPVMIDCIDGGWTREYLYTIE